KVTLPSKPPARSRWLNRSEAALLLAGSLGWYREFWCDVATRRQQWRWKRYAGGINRHLARFILLGLYTGSRKQAPLGAQWMANGPGGWLALDRSSMCRKAADQEETQKRQPATRLGRRIQAHLRRWKRFDDDARSRAAEQGGPVDGTKPLPVYLHVVSWR